MSAPRWLELGERWRRARVAALVRTIPGAAADGAEDATLAAAPADALPAAQRQAFEHSLALGRSFVAFHRAPVEPEELPSILPALAPCLAGTWQELPDEPAFRLERPPCARAAAAYCDHLRESIDGLVSGLTDRVRHVRHESAGRGGPRCVDVFYGDPESALRWAPAPPGLDEVVRAAERSLRIVDPGARLRVHGVRDGELHFELQRAGDGCGGCGASLGRRVVERTLAERFPGLVPREISPRPVLGPDGAAASPPPTPGRSSP